jgi:hypothetical protein
MMELGFPARQDRETRQNQLLKDSKSLVKPIVGKYDPSNIIDRGPLTPKCAKTVRLKIDY